MKRIRKVFMILCLCSLCFLVNSVVRGFTNNELEEGFIYEENIMTIDQGFDYYVNEVKNFDTKKVIVGYIYSKIDDDNVIRYPYVALYENDNLKWYKVNVQMANGYYTDCVIESSYLVVYGTFINKDDNMIFLYKYSLEGSELNNKVFNYQGDSFSNRVYFYNGYYYITGTTNSDEFAYKNDTDQDVFLMKLDNNFYTIDISYAGNDGNDELIDSIIIDNKIIFLTIISGSGYYQSKPFFNYTLIAFDERLDLVGYDYAYGENAINIFKNKDKIRIVEYDSISKCVYVYSYSDNLSFLNKRLIKEYKDEEKVNYVNVSFDEKYEYTCVFSVVYDYSSLKKSVIKQVIEIKNDKNEILDFYEKDLNNPMHYQLVLFNEGFVYIVASYNRNNNWALSFQKVVNIKVNSGKGFFNGTKVDGILEKEKNDIFGYYQGKIIYDFNGLKIESNGEYYVPIKVNIKQNATYNRGLKLDFNGLGKLNGKSIECGEIVNEVGNYVLEIKGSKDTLYYQFYVEDMICKDEESKYSNYMAFDNDIINTVNEENSVSVQNLEEIKDYQEIENRRTVTLLICTGVAALIGMTIALIPRRRKNV